MTICCHFQISHFIFTEKMELVTLSFIGNIFFLILLIEQLNFLIFLYIICFLFYSRILNTWRWKGNKERDLAGVNKWSLPFLCNADGIETFLTIQVLPYY